MFFFYSTSLLLVNIAASYETEILLFFIAMLGLNIWISSWFENNFVYIVRDAFRVHPFSTYASFYEN